MLPDGSDQASKHDTFISQEPTDIPLSLFKIDAAFASSDGSVLRYAMDCVLQTKSFGPIEQQRQTLYLATASQPTLVVPGLRWLSL